jgi:hypothetical protein
MPEPMPGESESAERRVYHAQLVTCIAVVPTFMGLTTVLTAGVFGDHAMRALFLAHPLGLLFALAIAMLFVFAWWLLGRRHRAGAVLALALFAWMLISSVRGTARSVVSIAFAAAGLVFVARAWPAMQSASPPAP